MSEHPSFVHEDNKDSQVTQIHFAMQNYGNSYCMCSLEIHLAAMWLEEYVSMSTTTFSKIQFKKNQKSFYGDFNFCFRMTDSSAKHMFYILKNSQSNLHMLCTRRQILVTMVSHIHQEYIRNYGNTIHCPFNITRGVHMVIHCQCNHSHNVI